jgi:uncharacterized protein (DUF4415 family)
MDYVGDGRVRQGSGCGLNVERRLNPGAFGSIGNPARSKSIRGKQMRRTYDFSKTKRGAVTPEPKGKTGTTIRLDDEIVNWFREHVKLGGGNYQSEINEALRQHIRRVQEPLETTLRRVIREELRHAS